MTTRYAPLALLLALFLLSPVAAQPFVIDQAVSSGGPSADLGDAVALAADGSRYVVGTFEGTATFGDVSVTSAGDSDVFLVKYAPDGEALWGRRGGTDVFNDFGAAVAVAPDGSVYAGGYFTGIATWDGGDNPDVVLTTFSDFDAFVAKYTPDGDLEWVRQAGGTGQDTGRDLATDAEGNVYFAGSFSGTGTFGDVTLQSAGSSDAFLVKYDPDGEVVWAQRGGSDQGDVAYGVAVTADGRAHLSGSFRGVAIFGDLPIQSAGETDVFVVQYDADGEPVWVEGIGADGSEFMRGGGIGLGADGSVYVTGSFQNSILVGNDVLASTGFTDVFVAKLSAEGDELWGRRGGGNGTNFSAALAVGGGHVLTTGYVDGTGTFAGEPIATQGRDGYLAVFDPEGDLVTVELLGGTGQDAGTGIAASDAAERFAATGSFRGTATFGDLELTSAGSSDVYLIGGPIEASSSGIIYVDADATGTDDGSSWANAFTDLQDALALAATMEGERQIWVAEGTYYPTDDGDRTVSFELQSGLALYGGFDGTETELDQRDWEAHETVLSGDLDGDGTPTNNTQHVVIASGSLGVVVDGFTVADGVATFPDTTPDGAGLHLTSTRVTVRHCVIRHNKAGGGFPSPPGRGAGMFVSNSLVELEDVLFLENSISAGGGSSGGAMYIDNGGDATLADVTFRQNSVGGVEWASGGGLYVGSTPIFLTDVLFDNNTVQPVNSSGGGMTCSGGPCSLISTDFIGNRALHPGTHGGGLHVGSNAAVVLSNSLFGGNSAPGGGGASVRGTLSIYNSVFVGNSAYFGPTKLGDGAGIRTFGQATLHLRQALFTRNIVADNAEVGGIYVSDPTNADAYNVIFWQNVGQEIATYNDVDFPLQFAIVEGGYDGNAVLDANPLFVRTPSPGPDGEWGTEDDDYGDLRLQEGSPAIDFGRAEFLPPDTYDLDGDGDTEEPLPIDLDGNPRVQGNEVDLGPYESPFAVALEPGAGVPTTSGLAPAYPNPFRSATTLALDVAEAQEVTVEVFDVLGRRVAVVHDGPLQVGEHRVIIESQNLPAGVYVVRAEGETFRQTQRVTLVR